MANPVDSEDQKTVNQLEHLLNVQNELGEGPVWNVQQQALYWVDIKQSRLYRYFPAQNAITRIDLRQAIMCYGFCPDGRLITACDSGLAYWDEATGQFEVIDSPEADKPERRFNDGAVDPAGRFWAGTMNEADEYNPVHALYRVDADGSVHQVLDDVMLSNGIGWSPDHTIMYFADSGRRQILKFDYDLKTGAIQNRRVFAALTEAEGIPDGLTVDSLGCVWNAIWDGGKVIRYSPDGKRLAEIELPVRRVTSCAFGGEHLNELYITTAHFGLSPAERAQQPKAGDLFRLKTDVIGLVEPHFSMSA